MAYETPRATLGGKDVRKASRQTRKRRKVKRTKPTTVNAVTGGEGVRRAERAARRAERTAEQREALQRAAGEAMQAAVREASKKTHRKVGRTKRKRRERAANKQLLQLIRGKESAAEQTVERLERKNRKAAERGEADPIERSALDIFGEEAEETAAQGVATKLGLVDKKTAGDIREITTGSRNPSWGELLIAAAPVPAAKGVGVIRAGLRGAKGLKTAEKAAKTAKAAETARDVRKAERIVKRSTTPGKAAKRRATAKGMSKEARARLSKVERKARRAKRQDRALRAATNPVLAAGAASPGEPGERLRALVEGHAKAIYDDPGKVAETTGRTALGIPAAAVGDIADLATGNFEEFINSQEEYIEQYAKLLSGDPEKVAETVKNEVGLIPAITTGLGAVAVGRTVRRTRAPSGRKTSRKVRRLADRAKNATTARERREAKEQLEETTGEPLRQAHASRKRESERAAVTGEKREAQFIREMQTTGRGRKRLDKLVGRLAHKEIDKNVSYADAIQILGRQGLDVNDPKLARRELEGVRARLVEPTRELDPDDVDTRAVLTALLDNEGALARVLRDKDMRRAVEGFREIQRGRSEERHETRTGERGIDPEDERARLLHAARSEGVDLPEERIPAELRGTTRVRPGRSKSDAPTRIRRSSRQARKRATRLRETAAALRDDGRTNRATDLERRADANEARAERQLEVVDRFRRAETLERAAARDEKAGDLEAAEGKRAEAAELREQGRREQGQRLDEFVAEANTAIEGKGLREPVYFRESDVADRGNLNVEQAFPGARAGKKERFRSGSLAEQGRIDESGLTLVENTYRNRAAMAANTAARDFLSENLLYHTGAMDRANAAEKVAPEPVAAAAAEGVRESVFHTGPEWRKLKRQGEVPPGHVLIPAQEFTAALQRGDAIRFETSLKDDVQRARWADSGKLYGAVPGSAIKQFHKQTEGLTAGGRVPAQSLACKPA